MADYPNGIWSPPLRGTNMSDPVTQTDILAEQNAEIVAVQAELGISPKGGSATVAARLNTFASAATLSSLSSTVSALSTTVSGKVSKAGDTMTATLVIDPSSGDLPLVLEGQANTPTLRFRSQAGTTMGDVQVTATEMTVNTLSNNPVKVLGPLQVAPTGGTNGLSVAGATDNPRVVLVSNLDDLYGQFLATETAVTLGSHGRPLILTAEDLGAERARFAGTQLLVGKSASSLSTAGVEIAATGASAPGQVWSTTGGSSQENVVLRHISSADANDQWFVQCQRTGSGTVIGGIRQDSTTGVTFETTSDGRLKEIIGEPADPLGVIERLRLRRLRWLESGEEFDGLIAQEVAEVLPSAASGDPNGDPVKAPMTINDHPIVMELVGAVQVLIARVRELEAKAA